jgi:hypothetical protein
MSNKNKALKMLIKRHKLRLQDICNILHNNNKPRSISTVKKWSAGIMTMPEDSLYRLKNELNKRSSEK